MAGTSGTGGKKRQIKARLEPGIDDALYELIAPFGERFQLSDLLRLAAYRLLLPDNLPDDLVQFSADFDLRDADPVERSPVVQQLADIAAQLVAIAQRPAQTQAPSQREVHSGGLDMRERPRKANHPKAEPGPDTQH